LTIFLPVLSSEVLAFSWKLRQEEQKRMHVQLFY